MQCLLMGGRRWRRKVNKRGEAARSWSAAECGDQSERASRESSSKAGSGQRREAGTTGNQLQKHLPWQTGIQARQAPRSQSAARPRRVLAQSRHILPLPARNTPRAGIELASCSHYARRWALAQLEKPDTTLLARRLQSRNEDNIEKQKLTVYL
jgi:hypothetical protein